VYRYSEEYSLPAAAFQYLNSITSPAVPKNPREKPPPLPSSFTGRRVEIARVVAATREPSLLVDSTLKAATSSQELPSCTGYPVWLPSSVTSSGAIWVDDAPSSLSVDDRI